MYLILHCRKVVIVEEEVKVEAEVEVNVEVLGSGRPGRRAVRAAGEYFFLKEMPLAVYQSRV